MFAFSKSFEDSLRKDDPTKTQKLRLLLQHKKCNGIAHGCGKNNRDAEPAITPNLPHDEGNFKRNVFRSFRKTGDPNPAQTRRSLRVKRTQEASNTKTKALSSDGCSETDSLDSNERTSKNKSDSISERLFTTATRASHAKTAQMRYLDEDVGVGERVGSTKQGPKKNWGENLNSPRARKKKMKSVTLEEAILLSLHKKFNLLGVEGCFKDLGELLKKNGENGEVFEVNFSTV